MPSPYYVSTPEIVKLWGGTPVLVPCRMENGFLPDVEELKAHLTPATRGIVLNSPCNPTGAVIPKSLLAEVLEMAAERGLFVIMDECYDRYVYGGAEYATLPHVDFDPALPFFIAGSFSKTFSMTGYRLGYAIGPADGHRRGGEDPVPLHERRDDLRPVRRARRPPERGGALRPRAGALRGAAGGHPQGAAQDPWARAAPAGGRLLHVPRSARPDGARRGGHLRGASERLLKEAGVMVIPGAALGAEGYLSISFAVPEEQIVEAVRRMVAFAGSEIRDGVTRRPGDEGTRNRGSCRVPSLQIPQFAIRNSDNLFKPEVRAPRGRCPRPRRARGSWGSPRARG